MEAPVADQIGLASTFRLGPCRARRTALLRSQLIVFRQSKFVRYQQEVPLSDALIIAANEGRGGAFG
jgi:hypothetical protein